jgi:hypothetical protein
MEDAEKKTGKKKMMTEEDKYKREVDRLRQQRKIEAKKMKEIKKLESAERIKIALEKKKKEEQLHGVYLRIASEKKRGGCHPYDEYYKIP